MSKKLRGALFGFLAGIAMATVVSLAYCQNDGLESGFVNPPDESEQTPN